MRTRRRRTRLCLAVVLVAVALVPVHLHARDEARDDRDRSLEELRAAAASELTAVLDVANQRTLLARTRTEEALAVRAGEVAAGHTDELTSAREAEAEVMSETASGLEAVAARLAKVSGTLGLQQLYIAPLQRCVDGVQRANDALASGDNAGAAAALDGSAAACQEVRSGTAPPVFPYDFPDPHVVRGPSGRWWAYATNSTAGAVQTISSPDLENWRVEGNALAGLPGWASPGATWAPAVVSHGGRWLLYYTVREWGSGLQCISVATASSPAGPFQDRSTEPLVCEREEGGSIDPDPVVDRDGRLHLLWKTELDTVGGAAELRGSRLDPTGTALVGERATLLRSERPWEHRTIEGPAMALAGGGYHLLYSGGRWGGAGYAVGAARCEGILGPCVRQSADPVLRSDGEVVGPGGLSVFATPYGPAVAFHAWAGDDVGYPANRYLHLGWLTATASGVVVRTGPTQATP